MTPDKELQPPDKEFRPPDLELQNRMIETYFWVRRGLILVGFTLPLILLGIGWWNHIHLQGSMSAYYFAFDPPDSQLRVFPARAVFVGITFAGGILFMFYKGFTPWENRLLNVAGFSAVVAALVPMEAPTYCTNCGSNTFSIVHEGAGILMFVCLGLVALFCTDETLAKLQNPAERKWFRTAYIVIAILLFLLPIAAIVMAYTLGRSDSRIFYAEWAAMWTFAAYWLLKTIELMRPNHMQIHLEKAALKGLYPQ